MILFTFHWPSYRLLYRKSTVHSSSQHTHTCPLCPGPVEQPPSLPPSFPVLSSLMDVSLRISQQNYWNVDYEFLVCIRCISSVHWSRVLLRRSPANGCCHQRGQDCCEPAEETRRWPAFHGVLLKTRTNNVTFVYDKVMWVTAKRK